MTKKLFFISALLVPCLAYGADPSGNLSVQVVPSTPTLPVPAGAQAAGFTTLAFNADFSQGMDIGCYPTSGAHQMYQGGPSGSAVQVPCNYITLTQDGGQQVLDMKWTPNFNSLGFYGANSIATLNTNDDCFVANPGCTVAGTDFGAGYFEATFRVDTVPHTSSNDAGPGHMVGGLWSSFFTWWTNFFHGDGNGIEYDMIEEHGESPFFASGGCINWGLGGGGHGCGFTFPGPDNISLTQYHKVAMRLTSDGSTAMEMCSYIDGTFIACTPTNAQGTEFTNRIYPMLNIGWGCTNNGVGNCQNQSIATLFQCDAPTGYPGAICLTPGDGHMLYNPNVSILADISGITGVSGVNQVWHIIPTNNATSDNGFSEFVLGTYNNGFVPSSWPGGSYTGGGVINAYTEEHMYVQSVRVWSCADWKTTMCNGTVLTEAP